MKKRVNMLYFFIIIILTQINNEIFADSFNNIEKKISNFEDERINKIEKNSLKDTNENNKNRNILIKRIDFNDFILSKSDLRKIQKNI